MEKIINYANKQVVIHASNFGIYSFGSLSSIGKSYLVEILNVVDDEDVLCLGYIESEDELKRKLVEFSKSNKSILIIDRFDRMNTKPVVDILKSMVNKYIFLDYKDFYYNEDFKTDLASLVRAEKGFSIYA